MIVVYIDTFVRKIVDSKCFDLEEQITRIEKEMKMHTFKIKENLQTSLEDFKKEVEVKIQETIDEKLPDVQCQLNDMSTRMSVGR